MNLVIIGAGAHAGVIIDAVHRRNEYRIVALLDDVRALGENRHGYTVRGRTSEIARYLGHHYFIAIGDNQNRIILWSRLRTYGLNYVNIIHPNAYIASPLNCVGTFFASNCHVGPNTSVGNFSVMNTRAVLEHDCSLGEFSHMAPGSVTGGHVKISDLCMVGIGAMIRDNVSIGRKTTIGMGSVVTKNVGENCTVYGNPAKVK